MSQPRGPVLPGTLLKLSVPTTEPLRIIADDIAARVADYSGSLDVASVKAAVESATAQAMSGAAESDVALEFRIGDRELLIEARCGSRISEVRCPLPT